MAAAPGFFQLHRDRGLPLAQAVRLVTLNPAQAVGLGDENFSTLSKKLLEDYLVQHQATMDQLREATDMSARDRADTLASMSDSFNKTMASFRRLSPELNRHAVALDALQGQAGGGGDEQFLSQVSGNQAGMAAPGWSSGGL